MCEPGWNLDELPVLGPPAEFPAVGQLQLPQNTRHMRFDGLDGDVQLLPNLAVCVSARDVLKHLTFSRSQLVEFRIEIGNRNRAEGIQDESGEHR